MSAFASTLRRFSRSSTRSKEPQSPTVSHSHAQSTGAASIRSSGTTGNDHPYISNPISQHPITGGTGVPPMHQNGALSDGRPISSGTDGSFDFANQPVTHHQLHHQPQQPQPPPQQQQQQHQALPSAPPTTMMPMSSPAGGYATTQASAVRSGSLSRTDKIVLKFFWDAKYQENGKRDLHYLKFPALPQNPSHGDLLPYCEIYHLIKTSAGANIISLGSANGVYIGFELQAGAQLHIDMDDEWHNISHHRVHFRSYESVLRDPNAEPYFKRWPKPLTIEFLEEEYHKWILDLMSICWEGREVRELGGPSATAAGVGGSTQPSVPAHNAGNPSVSGGGSMDSNTLPNTAGTMNGSSSIGADNRKRF